MATRDSSAAFGAKKNRRDRCATRRSGARSGRLRLNSAGQWSRWTICR